MRRSTSSVLILFLLGLFSQTQIRFIGSIGISEFFMFLAAPVVYFMDMASLKRHGFMPMLTLALLAFVGCMLSCWHNETPFQLTLRGLATTYAMFALPVVYHHFFKDDLVNCTGFKWYFVGAAISGIITIWGLHSGVEMSISERSGGDIASAELFFMRHFGGCFVLPLTTFYMICPTWIAVIIYCVPTVHAIVSTSSGRSAVLVLGITLFMLIYVNRKRKRMWGLYRKLWMVALVFVISIGTVMYGYKYAAKHGYLNESAQKKYEGQAKGRSALSLLMNGRGEFFIGLMAASQNPFWGYGPWPIDQENVYENYLYKYGDEEAIRWHNDYLEFQRRAGVNFVRLIPAHSFIVGHWVYYGLLGLPFWIYVLYKMVQVFKFLWAVPAWFGYFAANLGSYLWAIFFSPLSGRVDVCLFLTMLLLVIAAGKGKVVGYPVDMQGRGVRY